MKTLKDDKYTAILQASFHEFSEKGFKDASMRRIAQKANVGLSNIYNYFKNKDEIFCVIVNPAKEKLFYFISQQHSEEQYRFNRKSAFGIQENAMEQYIDLIFKYKEEFGLLLFHSQGSSRGNFRDDLARHMMNVSYDYMEIEKEYFPEVKNVSDFFLYVQSSWMISILGEIINRKLPRPKIREFFSEYFRFGYAGWKELTGT